MLASLVDTVNSKGESDKTVGVDHAYPDATDGYPIGNSIPGADTSKVAKCLIDALADVYSTALNFDEMADRHVDVGVDTTIAYHEVLMYSYCMSMYS